MEDLKKNILKLNIKNCFFLVIVREDNHNNTGDANYLKGETFETLEEAYNFYQKELANISTFESESEFKNIELVLNDENDIFEILLDETYTAQYSADDYGKFILHYLPKNDGISVTKIEIINEKTPFFVNEDIKYSIKSVVYNTKEEVIDAIYQMRLYDSKEEAQELFDFFLE